MGTTIVTTLADPTMDKALTVRTGAPGLRQALTINVSESGTATALDLTSAAWALEVASEPGDPPVISKGTTSTWTASGVKIVDASAGKIALVIVPADIAASLPVGQYHYQVTATMPASNADLPSMVWVPIAGTLNVVQGL